MSKKIVTLLLSLFIFVNVQAEVDSTWLVNQQNLDGSFDAQNDIGYELQNTSEALQSLYVLGDIDLVDESLSLQIINASDSSHLENVVRKIFVNTLAGSDVSALVAELRLFISSDGGFSNIAGYQSTVLDTALATQALAVSGSSLDDDFGYAVAYLINRQNGDGSWSSSGNASSVYITAVASSALQAAQSIYDVSNNISAANNFLISHIQSDIASVDTFEIAQSVLSIAASISDKMTYQFLLDHLISTRDIDGSWTQDIYTTALALHALYLGETGVPVDEDLASVTNPSSSISAVTGVITDNLTSQTLTGVTVDIITSNGDNVNIVTGADGRYTASNLFPGDATITVTHADYHPIIATPVLSSGVVHHFNPILIQKPQPTVVRITGKIVDTNTNLPLTGVSAQIVNSNFSTQTNTTGSFEFNDLFPGSFTIEITSVGYISETYAISAPSGGEVDLGLIALTQGSPTGAFGTVTGSIIDAVSGQALYGVAVSLSGSDNKLSHTDVDGRFSISDVNPGNANITAFLSDYSDAVSSVEIISGSNIHFNAILVKANDQAQVTIQGTVVDSETRLPLLASEVQVIGQQLMTLTNTDGDFQIRDVSSGSIKLSVSLLDYQDVIYSINAINGSLVNLGQIRLSAKTSTGGPNEIASVNVPGSSDLWLAGMPDGSTASSGDIAPDHSPVLIDAIALNIGSLTFTNVTGGVKHVPGCVDISSCSVADGEFFINHYSGALNGISDVFAPLNALMGVFLDDSQPDGSPAPETLNFQTIGTDFVSLSPKLKQVFFIGDGLTGNDEGFIQNFSIPQGATRLYLGTMDGTGWYNNTGAFNVDIIVNSEGIQTVDLTIDALSVDAVSTNLQTLQVNGMAEVSVRNAGLISPDVPVLVTVFEDSNANEFYDLNIDNVLGAITVYVDQKINEPIAVGIPLSGAVAYRDSPIYAMVDSDNLIVESDETNNVNNSLHSCRSTISTSSFADITVSLLKINGDGDQSANISVRIGNGGELSISQAVNINFYEGDPSLFGVLLGTITLDYLAASSYLDITLNNIPALTGNNDIFVVADMENSIQECSELNNTMSLPVFAGSVSATLTVETSATQYAAGSEILLQGSAMNDSAIPGQFLVQLHIEDEEGNLIQSFSQHSTDVVSGKTSVNVNDIWNSEGLLTGVYQLRGELFDLQGQLLSTNTQSFSLTSTAGATIASLRTNTDKAKYHTNDLVQIDNFIVNLSNDTVINDAQLHITITNSANDIVFAQTDSLSSIGRDSNRQRGVNYNFTNESEGNYWVNAQLLSSQNTVLASAYTGYIIESDAVQTVVGSTSVESLSLNVGQQQICTDNVQNIGDTDFASLAIEQVLIDAINQQVVQTSDQMVSLSAGDSQTFIRNVSTFSLTAGDYICALQADIDGSLHTLDFAVFKVNKPPIQVEGDLNTGSRGQLLIWFEAQDIVAEDDEKHKDSVDYNNDLIAQRQYLEALLNESGWVYTLVENRDDFVAEFSSGQYQAYLLFNGKEKLGKLLETALREAVNRGEGLIVTSRNDYQGHHESWLSDTGNNNALAEAFGIRVRDQHENVLDFNFVLDNPLSLDGTITFNETKHAVGLELNQAQAVLEYTLASYLDDEQKLYNTVVSYNQYGQGRALYAGFDVLAYATKYQDKALLKDLINQALDKTHPEALLLSPSSLVPVEVNIVNIGSDAVLQTRLIAPIDSVWSRATDGSIFNPEVIWQYSALAGSDRDITAWFQIPEAGGHVPVELLIKAGIDVDNFIDQDSKVLSIFANTPVMLVDIIVKIEDLLTQGYEQKTLKNALSQLEKSLKQEQAGKLDHANEDAIKATDELKDETDQPIIDVRLQIDEWLRLSTIRDTGLWFRYLDE